MNFIGIHNIDQLLKYAQDGDIEVLENETILVPVSDTHTVTVYKNPTSTQLGALINKYYDKVSNPQKGAVKIRWTYDKKGNKYAWYAYDAVHESIEDYLLKTKGILTNQGWG